MCSLLLFVYKVLYSVSELLFFIITSIFCHSVPIHISLILIQMFLSLLLKFPQISLCSAFPIPIQFHFSCHFLPFCFVVLVCPLADLSSVFPSVLLNISSLSPIHFPSNLSSPVPSHMPLALLHFQKMTYAFSILPAIIQHI
jgi:hypothetical protein